MLVLTSCQSLSLPSSSSPSSSEPTVNLLPSAEYETFWQPSLKFIRLEMQHETLRWIETYGSEKNNPNNDYYFPVTFHLEMNGITYTLPEVGIRQKGNIFSRGTFLNEEGELTYPFHFRLSFDQTFDDPFYESFGIQKSWKNGDPDYEVRQRRRFFDMKSLEFKWNRSNDPSLINQPFASRLFNGHDVIAPQSTLSPITFDLPETSVNLGMYIINEAIDQTFLDRHFVGDHAQGDLYKVLYPINLVLDDVAYIDITTGSYVVKPWMVGVENTLEGYHPVYDLKTNKSTSQHEPLLNLLKTLKSARLYQEEDRLERLSSVVDIPSFLRYASVSFLNGNPDDMRNNTNNTYVYFDGVTQQATFIPYDNDWSLGVTWDEALTERIANKSPYNATNSFDQTIVNPLYWLTLFYADGSLQSQLYPLIPSLQTSFTQHLITLKDSPYFTKNYYQTLMDAYQTHYETIHDTVTLPNPSNFVSMERFDYHHTQIQATLTTLTLSE